MNSRTQGLLLGFVGAVLIRLSVSDSYLRYVAEWMKWPVALSGAILLVLAVGPVLSVGERGSSPAEAEDDHAGHAHGKRNGGVPYPTWLLLLPGLVAFMIAPPALGSYLAERRAEEVVTLKPAVVAPVSDGGVVPVELQEFIWRAQDASDTLEGRTVELTGFVSYDEGGDWFVTRMAISCCAADAVAYRVHVTGKTRPRRDQWVSVTGSYVPGTGHLDETRTDLISTAEIAADRVKKIPEPSQTYS